MECALMQADFIPSLKANLLNFIQKEILLLNGFKLQKKCTECTVEIGKIRKEEGLPVFDASREQEILNRVAEKTRAQNGPLSPESMQRIFQTIMTETRQVEK